MPLNLTPQLGLLFRIVHVANLSWAVDNGLHCASGALRDPNFVEIGNPDLIQKRAARHVPIPPYGLFSDYVPFYFTPKSIMLYNIETGYNGIVRRPNTEIVILVTSGQSLIDKGVTVLFTDRHAYAATAAWSADLKGLAATIDWDILCRHDFGRSDSYPDKKERYQAEAFALRHVPSEALLAVGCVSDGVKREVEGVLKRVRSMLRVVVRPTWYFL
jgi:ssDNA thymidine ADP-ribosyltransferase, DarT